MKLGDSKGIKTGVWIANEILHDDDINYVGEATYSNITDQMGLMANQQSVDEVVSGLELIPKALLTTTLPAGSAISFAGRYLTDNAWAYVADAGSIFSVVLPVDEEVGFDVADPTNPRIDVVEIRPIQTLYNLKARQYKDPITGLITASPTNTRYEYGYEVNVLKGTAGASPVADASTAGWVKLAEVTVPALATTIVSADIKTYVDSGVWTTGADSTVPRSIPDKLTEDTTVNIYNTDDLLDAKTKIEAMPRNLGGFSLSIVWESPGTHSYHTASFGVNLEIANFYNGSVLLTSDDSGLTQASITFEGYAGLSIGGCDATVRVDEWLKFTKGSGYAYAGQDYFIDIANNDGVKFEASVANSGVTFDTGFPIINVSNCPDITFPNCDIVGGTVDYLLRATASIISVLPTRTSGGTYYALLQYVEVRDSSNATAGSTGTFHTSSIKYVLLDTIETSIVSLRSKRSVWANYSRDMATAKQINLDEGEVAWQNNHENFNGGGLYANGGGWLGSGGIALWRFYTTNAYTPSFTILGIGSIWPSVTGDAVIAASFSDSGQYGAVFVVNATVGYMHWTTDYGNSWTRTAVTGGVSTSTLTRLTYMNGYFYAARINPTSMLVAAEATPYAFSALTGTAISATSDMNMMKVNGEQFLFGVDNSGSNNIMYQPFITPTSLGTAVTSLTTDTLAPFVLISVGYRPDDGYYALLTTSSLDELTLARSTTLGGTWTVIETIQRFIYFNNTNLFFTYDTVLKSFILVGLAYMVLLGDDLSSGFDTTVMGRYATSPTGPGAKPVINFPNVRIHPHVDESGETTAQAYSMIYQADSEYAIAIFSSGEWDDLNSGYITLEP